MNLFMTIKTFTYEQAVGSHDVELLEVTMEYEFWGDEVNWQILEAKKSDGSQGSVTDEEFCFDTFCEKEVFIERCPHSFDE